MKRQNYSVFCALALMAGGLTATAGQAAAAVANCSLSHSHSSESDSGGGWWQVNITARCNAENVKFGGIRLNYRYWGEDQHGAKTYFYGSAPLPASYIGEPNSNYAGVGLTGKLGFSRYCYEVVAEYFNIPGIGEHDTGTLTKRTGTICWDPS